MHVSLLPLTPCDLQQGQVSNSRDLHSKWLHSTHKKNPVEASEVIWLEVLSIFFTPWNMRGVWAGKSAGRYARCVRACACVCLQTRVVVFSTACTHLAVHSTPTRLFFFLPHVTSAANLPDSHVLYVTCVHTKNMNLCVIMNQPNESPHWTQTHQFHKTCKKISI